MEEVGIPVPHPFGVRGIGVLKGRVSEFFEEFLSAMNQSHG